MATKNQSESALPVPGGNNSRKTSDLLPRFYKTDSNKKFFSATLDQLVQPGTVKKVSGYIGRQNAKSVTASDVFIQASDTTRQNYQLEPAAVIQDYLGNINFFKDYIDHINHVKVFGGNVDNHERLNKQEFYSWNPHIDWDKFVNFQQYYWLPYGPTPIEVEGQQLAIESTFTVVAEDNGDNYAYLFTPDGLTRNPTITLFRGQTYKFEIDALHNPFSIKTQRVAGTLDRFTDGVTGNGTEQGTLTFVVGIDSPDVLYYVSEADANTGGTFQIKDIDENTFLDINTDILGKKTYTLPTGVSLSNGMKVFFSGNTTPETYGAGYWYVEGVGTAIKLISEVDLEISGTYTEETALLFDDNPFDLDPFSTITNSPKTKDYVVINRASPDRNPWARYNRWFHQDVIKTSAETAGQIPEFDQTARANRPIIEFSAGLKLYNFGHKAKKNVDLIDNFTTDVFSTIEGSLGYNIDGVDVADNMRILFTADPDRLVKDRIFKVNFIEVTVPNRQINFNAATGINLTTKVITTSTAHSLTTGNQVIYLNNGELNINGLTHRKVYYVRVINDTDIKLYTNKLLSVEADIFDLGTGTHKVEVFTGLRRQINLVEEPDSNPLENETVLVNYGQVEEIVSKSLYGNRGLMYWYDGSNWSLGPIKSTANQQPLFDVFDNSGYSYSNSTIYDGSSFRGTKVFSYKVGTGTNDSVLGFPLSYQNINNVGDIQFEFNLLNDSFTYKDVADVLTKTTSVGYLKLVNDLTVYSYENGWKTSQVANIQPVVRIFKESGKVNNFPVDVFDFKDRLTDLEVRVYINGRRQNKDTFTVTTGPTYKTVVLDTDVTAADVVTLKCYSKELKNDKGHYETPISLQNNPLNNDVSQFTLGEVIDHVDTIVDNITTFSGTYPGSGNLRDLGNLTAFGARFVQHSAPLNFSLYHLGSQTSNIVKSLEQARDDYGKFKRAFITYASNAGIDTDPRPFVDIILTELAKDKPKTSSYYLSDMFGYSGSKRLEYTVLDSRVTTYPLTSAFNLTALSNKAVGIYLNGSQLLHGRDYTFGTDVFFTVLVDLVENDLIEVYEYESTDGSFCPPTPTKLGLYPLFEPKIYTDDTYLEDTTVIQGHDGSITIAYNDYRDDLLLELEMRIFNNIKVSYNSDIFDIYDYIPGYNRTTSYSKAETENVLGQFFFQWTANVNQDYTQPNTDLWSRLNPFTFNYRDNFAPNGTDIPGFWRGIYRWMLDTDRPHTHPWECLGFSIEPTWWQTVYGTVPYTSDNFVLWEDIRQGIIREPGVPVRISEKFAKPILASGKPVDEDGNLISPLYASYANGPIKETPGGYWIFGDQAPVETAWRRSSYYPFALIQTALLLHPSKVIGTTFDRSRIVRNLSNQLIYKDTGRRIRLQDLAITSTSLSTTRVQTSGLVNYIVDYLTSDTTTLLDQYADDLQTLTTKIAAKLGGFTSKSKFKLILDSKNPSSSGGVFIPEENYNIFLNTSSPTARLAYSGVVITKYADGYEVRGYIKDQPYFVYYPYQQSERVINIGGISESFINWTEDKYYTAGKIVRYNNQYFRVKINHQSTAEFNSDYYSRLAALPVSGGREAIIRKTWDSNTKNVISYGTKFSQIQEVVDFLQGYGAYLQDQGFVFDEYNQNLKSIDNWETSVKEFLFWTTQNWTVGAALAVSPSARYMLVNSDTAVVDNIQNSFYGYKIYRVDGEKLDPEFTNTYREENEFTLSPQNTNHGLYGAVLHTVQKEHVLLLDNVTQFNDVIYDQEPGYRQERIKVLGYVSANWNGGFNVPGFIFDTARISEWTQWTDYNLGDIVKYKEFYYSAKSFLPGVAEFNNDSWILLDEKPQSQLLPNWDYRAEQFTDFYDLDSDNFDAEQQKMAQHLIGYQKRQYLENIIQDDLSQYKFYQGMISEKGTQNVFSKLFDVLSADNQESLTFNEEWAVRVGSYGATDSYKEIEFKLDESLFKLNPQPIELTSTIDPAVVDFVYRQIPTDIVIKPVGYDNNIWPVAGTEQYLRTPGHVRYEDVKLNLDILADVLAYDISTFVEGDYVWCAFENKLNTFNDYWNVYRFTKNTFGIDDVEYASGTLTLQCDRTPNIVAGDIIGIENTSAIQGFYVVDSIVKKNIIIKTTIKDWKSPFTDSSEILTYKFVNSRSASVDSINDILPPTIKTNELVWADTNGSGLKTVYKNNKVYGQKSLSKASPVLANVNFGKKVAMAENGKTAAVADNNKVTIFVKNSLGNWLEQDVMTADFAVSKTTTARTTAVTTNIITADDTYSFSLNDPVMFSEIRLSDPAKFPGTSFGGIISGRTYFVKSKPSNVTFTISETPGGPTVELTSESGTMTVHLKLEYGAEMCFSPDAEWLAIAAPRASNVRSAWRGDYDGGHEYNAGDVVQLRTNFTTERSLNSHWTANRYVPSADWSTINSFSQDWAATDLITVNKQFSGAEYPTTGYENLGYVDLYRRGSSSGSYDLIHSFVSPNPTQGERFGSKMVMAQSGSEYVLAVTSPGTDTDTVDSTVVQGRVYMYRYGTGSGDDSSVRWQMDYDRNYQGAFDSSRSYLQGDIVFYDYNLYECTGDLDFQNPAPTQSSVWSLVTKSNILGYFPQESSLFDVNNNDLTLAALSGQTIESVQPGDNFGAAIDMSSDGQTLVISAPGADQDTYENYKGPFRTSLKYFENDVVYYNGYYYKFNQTASANPIASFNVTHWDKVSTETRSINSGKVFIYTYNGVGYELAQTLTSDNVDIEREDQFGESIAVSSTGGYIAVGTSLYDSDKRDAGRVIVFKKGTTYTKNQLLYSYTKETFERFGAFVDFMNDDETLVVFSGNGDVERVTTFDVYSRQDSYSSSYPNYLEPNNLTITHASRLNGIATVTTSSNHNLITGSLVLITCSDSSYNSFYTPITVLSATTFSYQNAVASEDITFTGDISGTTMTVVLPGPSSGRLKAEQIISGPGVPSNTFIISQTSGSEIINAGRAGTYILNTSSVVASTTLSVIGKKLSEVTGNITVLLPTGNPTVAISYINNTESTRSNNSTTIDNNTLRIADLQVDTGRVDIFDKYNENYIYGESLDTSVTNDDTDRYGASIAVGNNNIYVSAQRDDGSSSSFVEREGKVYAYYKLANTTSWTVLHQEVKKPNVRKIKKSYLYNTDTSKLISYLDVVDPTQGKIPGPADQEIKFKTYFDPAVYSVGTTTVNVDTGMNWTKSQVGMLWWDLTRAKFLDNQIGETIYRSTTWNKLYETASIDIYEWVESKYLPSEWDKLSGTDKGTAAGISGSSRYGDTVYSVKKRYDNVSKTFINTYYYWIKNPTITPNILDRRLSASDVSNLIADPTGQNYSCIALTGTNTFSLINATGLIEGTSSNLNVQYWIVDKDYTQQNAHSQWKILSEHTNTVVPAEIERKWVDSLVGKDDFDRVVPDTGLPIKQQFGISFRPRQSMFVNRTEALKQYIERVNSVLATRLIVDDFDISDLLLVDPAPSSVSGLWDASVDTEAELRFIGTANLRPAVLEPVITDGRISAVTIVDAGYGYVNAPYLQVLGAGKNANIRAVINATGQVTGIEIINRGEGYLDNTTFKIRSFSALVVSDSTTFDKWTIYQWDSSTVSWERTRSQGYDVTKYWSYLDWYSTGYNQFTKIDHVVENTYELAALDSEINQIVKVNNIGTGGWLLLEKYADTATIDYTENYKVVGRQNGTIKFSSNLYNFTNSIIGYGSDLYDSAYYDNLAVKELRTIISTIKNKIFVDDLKVEYLKLFFASVRYALHEQAFVDWAFKTSFVKATHNVGDLKQKVTYNSDNLESFEDYVNEVKPYRTQVREYISSYAKVDPNPNSVTDFDLPPIINSNFTIEPLTVKISSTGTVDTGFSNIQQYPWKHWYDHVGFKITTIEIVDGGSGYISNPVVRINGGFGSNAEAKAYIANGKVNRIQLINAGTGFLKAPEIVIDGGLSVDGVQARAVAIIESEVVRANKISIKFDRISKTYFVSEITETETFVGTGSRLQFALKFSPLIKVGSSSVKLYQVGLDPDSATVQGVDILREDYTLTTKKSTTKGYTSYSGLLTLTTAPAAGETIRITYTKDFNHLSATDRIKFYYNPTTGMLGKDADDYYAQLMTGVDYGGVSLTGLGFNIGGGWDTLPFFTDSWDGFDADFDDYITVVGDDSDLQYEHTLPYMPTAGTILNVYVNEQRIDDPYFDLYDGSTVQPNGRKVAPAGVVMKTIVADGTTKKFYLPNSSDAVYLDINPGDRIIFRKNTSDGSIAPRPEEYDTQLSGGNLAYTTATGLATDDINIDGDGFVTPMTSNAPEEVVPGQIVDTVAIKVFQLPTSGSSKILFKNYIANGTNNEFSLAQVPLQASSVFVKLDDLILKQGVDYTINWAEKKVVLTVTPANKKIVSVITFSVASEFLLDANYFVADGSTLEYITNAPWSNDDSTAFGSVVLVDGATVSYELFRTDESYATPNCVGINLTSSAPAAGSLITYMITSDSNSSASVIKTEELAVDGSTRIFNIANPVGLSLPYENNILVLVDGEILVPSMTEYFTMKDNSLVYNLAKFKSEPYVINPADCEVFVDGNLLTYSADYVFDLSVVSIILNPSVYNEGSVLAVVNYRDSEYTIDNDSTVAQITFATAPAAISTVEVVTFYNHNVENIIRTNEFIGVTGSLDIDTPDYYRYHSLAGNQLELFRSVKFDDYIWVIKNNQMLTHSVDYHLNANQRSITLATPLINSDVLDVVLFSDDHVTQGYGWMQFKDMLNRTHYKRISKAKSTRLAASLGQFDTEILVEDGSVLSPPNPAQNLPGVIELLGERIEYMSKVGNTLSRLRRGTLGTGVKTTYVVGTLVQDIGPTETMPYTDRTIVKKGDPIDTPQLYIDGTLELPYVPNINDIEVFVAGRRLKKSSYQLFQQEAVRQGKLDPTLASNDYDYPDSPEGDITFVAEFSVSGTSTLQLTELPLMLLEDSSENKFEVVVIKKIGQVWEDPGRTLQQSNGAVAKFLKDTETNFPEYPVE